jgi:hypothetical protein
MTLRIESVSDEHCTTIRLIGRMQAQHVEELKAQIGASGGVSLVPVRNLTLSQQHYFFWRASDRDALYSKAGAVLRPGGGTTARYVGAEIDLLANYAFISHLLGYAGYSRFFPGEFIHRTGPSRDSDFLYGALQYTF